MSLREKIIASSLRLFSEKGFHGVSVQDLVNDSMTSKGGFYHHFSSKDELLYVIHDKFITYVLSEAHSAKEKYDRPMKQLHEILKSFVRVFDLYNEHITVFYQENKYLKPKYEEIIKQKRNEFKRIIYEVINDGQQSGDFRESLPPTITTMSILGMVNWTYKWYQRDGDKNIEQVSSVYIDLLMHGLLTDEALKDYERSSLYAELNF
uniref:TetR/AcrR family transcriptional regulator n=1 Tax=uncultured Allobacillus sp. TaxID=1638025 RepID=UPI0025951C9D|nr:TetR/AcrR family transcriptional regulator [uncultured Allobacillus sp.]